MGIVGRVRIARVVPAAGTSWQVLTYVDRIGEFTIENDTGYDWLTFSMDYNDVTGIGTLTVLPEPASATLIIVGALAAIARRRKGR